MNLFTFTVDLHHPAEHGEPAYWAEVVRANFDESDITHTTCLLSHMIEAHWSIARGDTICIKVTLNGRNAELVSWEGEAGTDLEGLRRAQGDVERWAY